MILKLDPRKNEVTLSFEHPKMLVKLGVGVRKFKLRGLFVDLSVR